MKKPIALFVSTALSFAASGIYAEEQKAPAAEPALEEVVVTAERRTENLQTVPVTVTAVSNEQLASSNITNIQQLSALVPSLSVVDPTGYNMAFIRGIGSSTLGGGTFSSVAIYIDGMYIARTTNAMFELDGVENVQVLAGPQGALYGRNATAGAIVITSKRPKPGDPFKGNISASYGTYNTQDFSGSISGGLGDRTAFLLTGARHTRDGFVKNLNPANAFSPHREDMDDRDALSGSATFVFQPNDTMNFALRAAYSKSTDRAGGGYEAVGQDVLGPFGGFGHGLNDNRSVFYAVAAGAFGAFGAATADQIATEYANSAVFTNQVGTSYDNQRSGFDNGILFGESKKGSNLWIENKLITLNADFNFDNFTLKSATGYTDSDYHGSVQVGLEKPGSLFSPTLAAIVGAANAVLDAGGGLGFSSNNPSKVFQQGLQFLSNESAKVRWIAGADYSRESASVRQSGDGFGASNLGTDDEFTVTSSAVFAQATMPFASDWSATLGGRYTNETYDLIDIRRNPLPREKLDGKKFTYTARVQRQTDDWLGYLGVTSGFKTGTLNAATAGAGDAAPEQVTTVELGFKRDFVPRFRLNTAFYYSIYKDVQLNIIDQRTGGNILDNGPKASVKGIDLQAIAQVTKDFSLSLGATALDAKFTENSVNLPNIKGNRLPGSAKLAVSLVGDFNFPLASGAAVNFTATAQHNSGKFYDHLNLVGSGGSKASPYSTIGLNLAYKSPDDRYEISLWGNNILDEKYYRTGIVAFGTFGREAIAGNPANFGATVKVNF